MKTVLDNKRFRRHLKVHLYQQRIGYVYFKLFMANMFKKFRKPIIMVKGDPGDEIFDAIHESILELNIVNQDGKVISPYDLVEMKSVVEDGDHYVGITVELKNYEHI